MMVGLGASVVAFLGGCFLVLQDRRLYGLHRAYAGSNLKPWRESFAQTMRQLWVDTPKQLVLGLPELDHEFELANYVWPSPRLMNKYGNALPSRRYFRSSM
jgi:hypothetical protein